MSREELESQRAELALKAEEEEGDERSKTLGGWVVSRKSFKK